jgi:NAD(P)-dependent dehydrogenase (short-subunit alcohol dehydrogenase family)
MAKERWTAEEVPDQSGRTIIVTGGNSGIGYEAALVLAGKGAAVVLACRDPAKAADAVEAIRSEHPTAQVEAMALDLASLATVREFAKRFLSEHGALDILCNNAGVMAIPHRRTEDGFEMQLGTNHLGHFALTGLLLERLLSTEGARVVNVSSNAHRFGRIDFDNLDGAQSYQKWRAYGQSKLANLLFTHELQRRLEATGSKVISVACHPGYSATNLAFVGPRMEGSSFWESVMHLGARLLSQSAAMGALPTLYACTAAEADGGDYIGPDGFLENQGYPKKVRSNARSHDRDAAAKLWEVSESMTGVRYDALRR